MIEQTITHHRMISLFLLFALFVSTVRCGDIDFKQPDSVSCGVSTTLQWTYNTKMRQTLVDGDEIVLTLYAGLVFFKKKSNCEEEEEKKTNPETV